jgi:hypothetical protein
MWTCDLAPSNSCAILGKASAPSIKTSSEHPPRGGGSPAAQPPAEASKASNPPTRANRRR